VSDGDKLLLDGRLVLCTYPLEQLAAASAEPTWRIYPRSPSSPAPAGR
jgi:hypothetical protein